MSKLIAVDLVLDNYMGGDTKEICVATRQEYNKVLSNYLIENSNNFATVRGINKSHTIELGFDGWYSVYETTNPTNRVSLALDLAIDYAWENANHN